METKSLSTQLFGNTGREVTIVGLGGEGVLRTFGKDQAAQEVIETALDQGITYFDSARAYAGSETYYGRVWPRRPSDRARIFQTSKSAMRTKNEALLDLDLTLQNMGLEYLDLWQIHDLRTEKDFQTIAGPGGALEAFVEAKNKGKIRFIGLTGHHDPELLTRAVKAWPIDSVLIPVNPVEVILGGFLTSTLKAAQEKGVAIVGMKVLGASHYIFPQAEISAELLIRFALSQPITLAVVGCSTPEEVKTLARVGRGFEPLSAEQQQKITDHFLPYARRLAFYRGVI
ncbi:MAG: aldo/keto reductase [Desulfobacca sp.]|nr:aldo/keto reductase [Desulfobacca sp.]